MKYDKFRYLYPPRAKNAIKPLTDDFMRLFDRGYKAQLKMNGQRNVIFVSPEGKVQMWNRHGEMHRNYSTPEWLINELFDSIKFSANAWTVIDGELLHNKDKSIKNVLYVWDALVYADNYLVGSTYENRYTLLNEIMSESVTENFVNKHTDHIWSAKMIEKGEIEEAWKQTEISYVEGVVFKEMNAKLSLCVSETSNSKWQIKSRKPTKSYKF